MSHGSFSLSSSASTTAKENKDKNKNDKDGKEGKEDTDDKNRQLMVQKDELKNHVKENKIKELLELGFKYLGCIGRGAFGVVYCVSKKCVSKEDEKKQIFAVKELKWSIETTREISALKSLQDVSSPHVVHLWEVLMDPKQRYFYLVFKYYQENLRYFNQKHHSAIATSEFSIAVILKQITQGLERIHSKDHLHRDLKPENILVLSKPECDLSHEFAIADFSLAVNIENIHHFHHPMNVNVATLWYRSPILSFGSMVNETTIEPKVDKYGYEVDLWALGCIMAELVLGFPLFQQQYCNKILQDNTQHTHLINLFWKHMHWFQDSPALSVANISAADTTAAATIKDFKCDIDYGSNQSGKIVTMEKRAEILNARLSPAGLDLLKQLLYYPMFAHPVLSKIFFVSSSSQQQQQQQQPTYSLASQVLLHPFFKSTSSKSKS